MLVAASVLSFCLDIPYILRSFHRAVILSFQMGQELGGAQLVSGLYVHGMQHFRFAAPK